MLIAESFTIAMIDEHPKCPSVDAWVKQLWDIHTMEHYWALKRRKCWGKKHKTCLQQHGWA